MASLVNRLSMSLKKKKAPGSNAGDRNSKEAQLRAEKGPPPNPNKKGETSWTINDELAKVKVSDTLTDAQRETFVKIMGKDKYDYMTTQYHLGIAMGVFGDYSDGGNDKSKLKESMSSIQWVFYTENDLSKSLEDLLAKLMSDELVVQDGTNDAYSVKE